MYVWISIKSSVDFCKIFLVQQTGLHYYLLYKKIMVTGCDSFMSIVEDWSLFSQFGCSCMIMKCTQILCNVDSGCLGYILFDWVIYSSKGLVQKYIMQSQEKKKVQLLGKKYCVSYGGVLYDTLVKVLDFFGIFQGIFQVLYVTNGQVLCLECHYFLPAHVSKVSQLSLKRLYLLLQVIPVLIIIFLERLLFINTGRIMFNMHDVAPSLHTGPDRLGKKIICLYLYQLCLS